MLGSGVVWRSMFALRDEVNAMDDVTLQLFFLLLIVYELKKINRP